MYLRGFNTQFGISHQYLVPTGQLRPVKNAPIFTMLLSAILFALNAKLHTYHFKDFYEAL
ncbi:hypothetical protein VCHA34P129_40211 [Vibrio chagasii]|nr:hypothetical protein VCHA34P129_40211 [Vibrio chagasii]CAH7306467.1 hypothetical protein VCHA52P455_40212 [Vibrio chagasii]